MSTQGGPPFGVLAFSSQNCMQCQRDQHLGRPPTGLECSHWVTSMVRFVTTKESSYVGRCIYCGATKGKLTEEHVSPFGLNGCVTLLEASCLDCNKVTG